MAESLAFSKTSDRRKIYDEIAPQIEALVVGRNAIWSQIWRILRRAQGSVRFFLGRVLFQKRKSARVERVSRPIACTRIDFDKGVCGHCYTTRETVIVPNVDEFAGHIACSSLSKSEIVLPIFDKTGEVFGVLDVDSDKLDDFSETDAEGLRKIVEIIEKFWKKIKRGDAKTRRKLNKFEMEKFLKSLRLCVSALKKYDGKICNRGRHEKLRGKVFPKRPSGHFRDAQGLTVSSIGIGTYLGNWDAADRRKLRRGRSQNLSNRAET